MDRRFLVVWVGQMLSGVGSTITGFALLVKVFIDTGEIFWLAVLTLASVVPQMAAAPLMGVVDRYDRRQVMIVADTAAAVVTLVLVGLLDGDSIGPGAATAIGAAYSFIYAFQHVAYGSLMPALVADGDLDRANGLVQLGPSIQTIVGPGLAGILLTTVGLRAILAIDLVTFAIALATLLSVKVVALAPEPADEVEDSLTLGAAVRWIRNSSPAIGYLLAFGAAANLVLGVFNVSVLAQATNLGDAAGSGLPSTAGGVAMFAIALVIGARGLPARRMRTAGAAAACYGALLILSVARVDLAWFVVWSGVAIGLIAVIQPAMTTTFQEHVPGHLHGRVFGLRVALGRGTTPIGNLLAVPLGAWSVAGSIAVAGVGLTLVGLAMGATKLLAPIDRPPG